MSCVSTVSYSVLLNGRSHGFIKPERGIRQGDPLSPFLFILCAEALVSCLNQAEVAGCIKGIRLADSGPSIHHLLFADDSLLMCKASVEEAKALTDCLKSYGDASGQEINKSKSSIIFGKKVPLGVQDQIKATLDIVNLGGEGSYLGLPECLSGSKRKLLGFIREKLQGRLNGWFAKALSQGGKEILLKSIGLAIPVFAMSCFKLPKDVCTKLTSVMTEFWWSSKTSKKKIPWVAWKKMCRPKDQGGLGFRDISHFNQALLGKQAWRVWSNPSSLLHQILKHRYFKNHSFLNGCPGRRPSYAWRSILHGRDLMQKGLINRIGDGQDTRMWIDNWIMDVIPRIPRYRLDANINLSMKVSELINPQTGLWKLETIRRLVMEEDVQHILNVKTRHQRNDSTIWSFSNNGMYSSKSGYKLIDTLQGVNSNHLQGLPPIETRLWSRIWKLKTSPKIRHFLWKALSGALAVKERIQARGIMVDSTCNACDLMTTESICHVLFHCRTAKETWDLANIPLPQSGFSQNSVLLNVHHLLSHCQNRSNPSITRLNFPWILWHLWKARNAVIFENIYYGASTILDKSMEDASEWYSLNVRQTDNQLTETRHDQVLASPLGWQKPPPDMFKCNIGAAWCERRLEGGVAWIIRDQSGKTLFHSRRSYVAMSSVLETELWSIIWAIESSTHLRFDRMIFENESSQTREALLYPHKFPMYRELIDRIFELLHSFGCWSLVQSSYYKNQVAIAIAQSVTRDDRRQSYIARDSPRWLRDLVILEGRGI